MGNGYGQGGARVGAGRKAQIEEKTITEILRLSAYNIIRALRSPELKLEFKAELGKHFILKKIPTVIESDGSFAPKTIILMRNEKALNEAEKRANVNSMVENGTLNG